VTTVEMGVSFQFMVEFWYLVDKNTCFEDYIFNWEVVVLFSLEIF
jgi:hypothetical protein